MTPAPPPSLYLPRPRPGLTAACWLLDKHHTRAIFPFLPKHSKRKPSLSPLPALAPLHLCVTDLKLLGHRDHKCRGFTHFIPTPLTRGSNQGPHRPALLLEAPGQPHGLTFFCIPWFQLSCVVLTANRKSFPAGVTPTPAPASAASGSRPPASLLAGP